MPYCPSGSSSPWHLYIFLSLSLSRSPRVCPSSTVAWKWSTGTCVWRTSSSTRAEPGRSWASTSASPPPTPQTLRCVEKGFLSLSIVLTGRTSLPWRLKVFILMFSCPLQPKYTCKEWEPNLPPLCLPNPEYLAPEYILSVSCDSASDMYSLGVVMHAVFNEGKPVFQVNKHDIFKSFSRQLDQVKDHTPF